VLLVERPDWTEVNSRRAQRAVARRRSRRRNLVICGVAGVVVIAIACLVTFAALSGNNASSKPHAKSTAAKKQAKSTQPARETAPSSEPVAQQTAPAPAAEPAAAAAEPAPAPAAPAPPAQVPPVPGAPLYSYTKDGSIASGHWSAGSTDYPYFGAARENGRKHGAIDVYPPSGRGTPVRAIKDGTVVQVVPAFYTRADGEVCCGILIDHGDFVAFYGEMASPAGLSVGQTVKAGQQIGTVSGTVQLHLEMYTPGTRARGNWYGDQPANLMDPTQYIMSLGG
jgi:murein DD-endopeptidase MepM/ murein hydrolase activator NlpD